MRVVVTAIADIPRLAVALGVLEGAHHVTLAQHVNFAGVDVNEVEVIGLHAAQRLVYALRNRGGSPFRCGVTSPAACPHLVGEPILVAAVADKLAESLFAFAVAGRGVDVVDATIKERVEQLLVLPRASRLSVAIRAAPNPNQLTSISVPPSLRLSMLNLPYLVNALCICCAVFLPMQ